MTKTGALRSFNKILKLMKNRNVFKKKVTKYLLSKPGILVCVMVWS